MNSERRNFVRTIIAFAIRRRVLNVGVAQGRTRIDSDENGAVNILLLGFEEFFGI